MVRPPGRKVKMVDPHGETELRACIEAFFFGFRAFTALPDALLAERGLVRTHHRILYFVRRDPQISVGELIATLGVTKQALHAPLKELERQGLVGSVTDAADRRIRRLQVTETGAALEAALSRAQMDLLTRAFDGAGTGAQQTWMTVMQRLASEIADDASADGAAADDASADGAAAT